LETLGAADKPVIIVNNKIDLVEQEALPRKSDDPPAVFVSAVSGQGLEDLLAAVAQILSDRRLRANFFIPYEKSSVLALLHEKGRVLKEEHGQEGISVEAEIEAVWAKRAEARLRE
jgi:GTP-binding protein HflX